MRVRAIAAGGAGVGDLPDGRVVFVPRTAPGDRARIRIERSKPRWALGTLDRLLEPSPDRCRAPCPLYGACGGCQLQHLAYESQLAWKGRIVADALERIAGIELGAVPEVVASPSRSGYRSRLTFTLQRLGGGRVVAGFHMLGRPGRIVDVQDQCLLPEKPVLDAWVALRAAWGEGAALLPPGRRLRLTLRAAAEGTTLLVEGGGRWRGPEALARAVPGLVAVWHAPDLPRDPGRRTPGDPRRRRRPGREDRPARPGSAGGHAPDDARRAVPRRVAGDGDAAGALSFEQVNREVAELLRAHVLERVAALAATTPAGGGAPTPHAGPEAAAPRASGTAPAAAATPAPTAVDAYCGAGPYGRALAASGWVVTGIERNPAACRAARDGAPAGFRVLEGAVEDRLDEALPADVVLLNPPRGGLHADVPGKLLERPAELVAYVSCDPATLARDLEVLRSAYRLRDVRCFDLFPQTAHVETVAVLERVEAAGRTGPGRHAEPDSPGSAPSERTS